MAGRVKKKREQTEYFFDYTLLFVILFLLGFGLIMIYSVSSYEAYAKYNDAAYFLKKQLLSGILGLIAMIVVANIPYHFWARFSELGYLVSAILVIMVPFFGVEANGAKRWLPIPGIGLTIQPAEVAKLCMILFLANLVCSMGKLIRQPRGMIFLMLTAIPMVVLVWKLTNNLSSAIIILGISVFMIFVASPDYKLFIILGAIGSAAVGGLLYYISKLNMSDLEGFRFKRILAWMNPEAYASDVGYQTLQSLYAIGSGGVFGLGLGKSRQKYLYLPFQYNDYIFAIICEELGLLGALLIIALFSALILRGYWIALRAPDRFSTVLAAGLVTLIAVQTILNLGVVTNLLPSTGIALPFFSYGGTALAVNLGEMGIVLSISRYRNYPARQEALL